MNGFEIIALLLTLAAAFSYLNHRLFALPGAIGLMIFGLLTSFALIALGELEPSIESAAIELLQRIDFDDTLMQGMLGFLLFAGALHVNLDDLVEQGGTIAILASVGLVLSTAVIGALTWLALGWLGVPIPFSLCLLFGALISPTDPIAVLGILKTMAVPKALETKIAGESLFNDGVAVVLFLGILGASGLADAAHHGDGGSLASQILSLFALETLGGAAFGAAIGLVAYTGFRTVDNYEVEILISLALVGGGYALAQRLHVSGPIAMVVAGLLIGNRGRRLAMSATTREHLDTFWKLLDEILNAVLFVLIGLEVIVLRVQLPWLVAALVAIPITLLARSAGVALPLSLLRLRREFSPHAAKILTWGGLRGGISVALALSLASSLGQSDRATYEGLLMMTYVVVCFSILVQGLTIGPLLRKLGVAQGDMH